jgi:hypothetical protein
MLDLALELAGQSDSEAKWSQLGELALGSGQLEVAQQCFGRAKDLGGLLLLHSSHADAKGMGELAALAGELRRQSSGCGAQLSAVHAALWERCLDTAALASSGSVGSSACSLPLLMPAPRSSPCASSLSPIMLPCFPPACLPPSFFPAEAAGKQNIAFICHFLLGRLDECVDLLVSCGRLPEAAFFARTYAPSRMTDVSCRAGWGAQTEIWLLLLCLAANNPSPI